jgi:predicted helicase
LKIAETVAPQKGTVLFLVPSISLLSQSLREWTNEREHPFHAFAVCSDTKVGKPSKGKDENEDISIHDLCFPASTKADSLMRDFNHAQKISSRWNVVFSTYQSIEAVSNAQKAGLPEFDMIICDEAHRTTGATLSGADESHFVKVHDNTFIKAKKRLYMTATPKLFKDEVKAKALENDALLCSMDDESLYGIELYRLGFGKAVEKDLLSDYKVLILAVDEGYIPKTMQAILTDEDNQLKLEDVAKITGCWNGLAKRNVHTEDGMDIGKNPMRRAVAFSRSIKDSEKLTNFFVQVVNEHIKHIPSETEPLRCELDHVDGGMNSLIRNEKLSWLKEETHGNVCRILSNARCLSEGVDVPSLDAVLFLNPRNSMVDVVQSVGRVMRKSEGKDYGYIILPIGIPAGVPPEEALKDNQKYKVVWDVLQALRAHDDRFNATINKIELNQKKPDNVQVIGVGSPEQESDASKEKKGKDAQQLNLALGNLEEWRDAIYAKIVTKCGERKYWETWAKDVAQIAERHVLRLTQLMNEPNAPYKDVFERFVQGLRLNLNPSISEADAIEMLAQHLITKPVFDALFENYAFTEANPVSQAMQHMLDILDGQGMEKEHQSLEKFYESIKSKVSGVDNAQGKQKIILELYDKFFKTAFPKVVEKLGIVYTPVEVVDFIIHSANDALQKEFGKSFGDAGVHVLDPFTGTGTFMVRLLQSGLIPQADLARKYQEELHANELVLLAYYIAAINIEETYHGLMMNALEPSPLGRGQGEGLTYTPFEGMVLTDTFQLTEGDGKIEGVFPDNSTRANKQRHNDIRVIIGNPPYSAGQKSENDGNQNLKYPTLDFGISETYAKSTDSGRKNSLYDSYIRAIRWASNRIKDKGVICFVTNGSFIENRVFDGFRKCLAEEFTSLYIFNLRGFIRAKVKEDSKREGQNIFDILTGVAITLLIKNPEKTEKGQVFYHDIGDYLDRKTKLQIITEFKSVENIPWKRLTPNSSHDWINQRDPAFSAFLNFGDKKNQTDLTIFNSYSSGIVTNRDAWIYNFSELELETNLQKMINVYNSQVNIVQGLLTENRAILDNIQDFIETDHTKIKWVQNLKQDLVRGKYHTFNRTDKRIGLYRPYCKQSVYFNSDFTWSRYLIPHYFPMPELENLVICLTGSGNRKPFSALISAFIPDLELLEKAQCFPLYTYEKVAKNSGVNTQTSLLASETGTLINGYRRKDNIPDAMLAYFQEAYPPEDPHPNSLPKGEGAGIITKEDIFYYVYGVLHSPEYKERFEADLKKMLPRLPLTKTTADFWQFSKIGRELAYWHLNYESIEPYDLEEVQKGLVLDDYDFYRIDKMSFPKGQKYGDKPDTIIYNNRLSLQGIPPQAWDYVVNGKPALSWIMERYAVTVHKESQIKNDPNLWCVEQENARYIVDLVKRVTRVAVESVRLVAMLPALNEQV